MILRSLTKFANIGIIALVITGCNADNSSQSTTGNKDVDSSTSLPKSDTSAKTKYEGLHSGMTQKEVVTYLQLEDIFSEFKKKYAILNYDDSRLLSFMFRSGISQNDLENVAEQEDFTDKEFETLHLSFTQDKILWRISILFRIPGDILAEIALKKSLEKHFTGHTIKKESVINESGTTKYYTVIMIDNALSDKAIEKYVQSYLKKM